MTALDARVWVAPPAFPEHALGSLQGRLDAGVCLSGGGTRALSAAIGQLRALARLGLLERVGYLSAVSGGTWAATPYVYAQAEEAALLGDHAEPGTLTFDALGECPPGSLGRTATRSLRSELYAGWRRGVSGHRLWEEAIGRLYLEPFGLFDPARPTPFTFDDASLADLRARNPGLAGQPFHVARPGRPYLLLNSTLIGPAGLAPFREESVVHHCFSPLYAGNRVARDVTYRPVDRAEVTLPTGGGFLEAVAFGAAGLAPGGRCQVEAPERLWSLAAACGASSTFYGSFIEEASFLELLRDFEGLEPTAAYWPLRAGAPPQTTSYALADGGVQENYGLLPLLARGVTRLLVCINGDTPLSLDYDPARAPGAGDLDTYLPPLFGIPLPTTATSTGSNQVFAREEFAGVVRALQAAKRSGAPVLVRTEHTLLPNVPWGIPGGGRVQVCWAYNDRVADWERQLPPDVFEAIEAGNHGLFAHGPLRRFPNYSTVEENFLDLVELTPVQVNLLAHLSCWGFLRRGELLRELFA